jgi:hypothetical protein
LVSAELSAAFAELRARANVFLSTYLNCRKMSKAAFENFSNPYPVYIVRAAPNSSRF